MANFHTHPLSELVQGRPEPSTSDMNNAYHRGLPGIVISRKGIYAYGPTERNGTRNPRGYAPSVILQGVPRPFLIHRGPPPRVVMNQWPEGTGLNPKPRTRELDFGQEQEVFEIPGLEKGKKLLGHVSHLLDKVAPHRHDHDKSDGMATEMEADSERNLEDSPEFEGEAGHDDVLYVDWSEEGIEYGEHLEEVGHD